jgi:hypothetical protein
MAKMTEEQAIGELRATLNSPGWKIIANTVQQRAIGHYKSLVAGSSPPDTDDRLRGKIQEDEWFLEDFAKVVRNYEINQAIATQQAIEPAPVGSPYAEADNPSLNGRG